MNRAIIRYILGSVLKIEAALMLLPCIVAVLYKEQEGFSFLLVAILSGVLGIIMTLNNPKNHQFYLKEGCIITSLSWILLSIVGAVPFVLTGEIPSFTDALFETISGFTTTGASILSDVEVLSYTSLFWRSFTHWIGGMGVLVFLMAIVPLSGGSNIHLMKAESPGPTVGKLVPKMKYTARLLYLIYFGLTITEIILLLIGGMPLFDSMTITFGSVGTGGFGIKNSSCADYSPYLQWVITIFMILSGINFNAYYLIIFKQFKKAFSMEEVRAYLGIIFTATGIIFIELIRSSMGIFEALTHALFQVGSIITTTGYATADFNEWTEVSRTILVLLMFIGACAGSTGGGIKVSRFITVFKTVFKEINSYIHPRSIKKIKMDGKPIDHETMRATNVYFITFLSLFILSLFVISFEEKDLITNFTAVAATINNIGPGLEMVGPTQNFAHFSPLSKYVLMFDMLAGRLELFPMLLLFVPTIWKEFFTHNPDKEKKKERIQP